MTNLKIGDVVYLFIEEREDAMGQLVLSRRKAKLVKGWEYVQKALDKDEIIEGFVKRRTKGGLIVDVFGIEAFLQIGRASCRERVWISVVVVSSSANGTRRRRGRVDRKHA